MFLKILRAPPCTQQMQRSSLKSTPGRSGEQHSLSLLLLMLHSRFTRLLLILRVLAASRTRGRANTVPKEVKVVIAVLSGKLGDIVCSTPVLRALRAHLPSTRIIAAGLPGVL